MEKVFLPVAESQVYERLFIVFLQIKKIAFEKLHVADSQVYERIFNAFCK